MSEMNIILPAVSKDRISTDLRELTQEFEERGSNIDGGILGGAYGYGADYENEVFEMVQFRYDDCDCGWGGDGWGYGGEEEKWLDAHPHTGSCYQNVIRNRGFIDWGTQTELSYTERSDHNDKITRAVCVEMGIDPNAPGSYVHCTCGQHEEYIAWRDTPEGNHDPRCVIARPNFRHKASGFEVRWYKYIGRGMEFNRVVGRGEWRAIYLECLESLGA